MDPDPSLNPIAYAGDSCALLRLNSPSSAKGLPLLVVPSPIAHWTQVHPAQGPSLLRSLSNASHPVYCLNWGDDFVNGWDMGWDDLVLRIQWAREQVCQDSCSLSLGLIGFSLGGTLITIAAALDNPSLLINLLGPIDFHQAGFLFWLCRAPCFRPDLVAASLPMLPPAFMKLALDSQRRAPIHQWLHYAGPCFEAFSPTYYEVWQSSTQFPIPLPPRAFVEYIENLVRNNELLLGNHRIAEKPIDLRNIRCPVLAMGAERDTLCPAPSVMALLDACTSPDKTKLLVPGGHLGSILGPKAQKYVHEPLIRWLDQRNDAVFCPSPG